ncbi:DNA mismatch repair protein MutL [Ceratobasidium sp. AG-Ba]|nr:DNA mismatch repair protein MutL [Ceratobasidium sp. AG-Ba]
MDIDQAPSVAQIPDMEKSLDPVALKEPAREGRRHDHRKKPRQRRPTRPAGETSNRSKGGDQVDTAPAGAGLISETNWAEPDAAQAELSLSRVIQKKDFLAMEILGQFNLGFVIARLRKRVEPGGKLDDLFIIDQHAADEKFNFERLQRTTKIQSQRLIRPRLLELSITDELTAIDNLEVLKKNGFVVQVDKDVPDGDRPKLRLAAQPMSKDTMFDMKDLEEILHQMQEGNSSETVRCTKARAMFAMRACRSSIMIGTALKQRHMVNMVRNLAGMDLPWNCPHGRPTMRHLCNLRAHSRPETPGVDWKDFSVLEV